MKKCVQTYGYLKGGSTVYEINVSGTNSITTAEAICTVGKIKTENEGLYLDTDEANAAVAEFKQSKDEIYVINVPKHNVFISIPDPASADDNSESKNNIVIGYNATLNSFYYDNLYSGDYVVLTISNTQIKVEEINIDSYNKLKVFTCEINGKCIQKTGFVTNNNNYYSFVSDGTVSKMYETKATCKEINNIGELRSDGKLCISINDETIDFLDKNSSLVENYIIRVAKINENDSIEQTYKLVTSIHSIFLIDVLKGN